MASTKRKEKRQRSLIQAGRKALDEIERLQTAAEQLRLKLKSAHLTNHYLRESISELESRVGAVQRERDAAEEGSAQLARDLQVAENRITELLQAQEGLRERSVCQEKELQTLRTKLRVDPDKLRRRLDEKSSKISDLQTQIAQLKKRLTF